MLNQRKKENPKYQQECVISHYELIKCCIFACYICREASRLAFEKMKYSLTAPDIITEIPSVVNNIYYL